MKKLLFAIALAGMILLAPTFASAQCCDSLPCGYEGDTLSKGPTPDDSQCCNAGGCYSYPGAGYACDPLVPPATAGCIDVGGGTCFGGDATRVLPGCIGVGGVYLINSSGAQGCTLYAVSACCEANACH
jgi:hypothetical protein